MNGSKVLTNGSLDGMRIFYIIHNLDAFGTDNFL